MVNMVNLVRKQCFTSRKRVKFRQEVMSDGRAKVRQKVISNGLSCLKMLSPLRMAGKKASSKRLCGFVFLLHILEKQSEIF